MADYVYAIGDVHGCLDHHLTIRGKVQAHSEAAPKRRRVVVDLGDYVDRGFDSNYVIETLMGGMEGFEEIFLKGNHEDIMVKACMTRSLNKTTARCCGLEAVRF